LDRLVPATVAALTLPVFNSCRREEII
jgi:hypothetical protein